MASEIVNKFVEVVADVVENNKPMPTWDDFYDANDVPMSDRTDFGTSAIFEQAMPILKERNLI
ncbi:hypothetical protein [Paenibacillus illinoisensis]|uniref:hypothetical protein n=1 Tax=Paenibacillus illinoisensis TaxID=59845 RepID=UPI003017A705